MPGIRRTAAGLTLSALAAGALACLDDTSSAPRLDDAPASLLLNATASAGAAVDVTVGIRVYYQRGNLQVDLPSSPSRVTLAAGESRRQAVTVQLARCLADEERAGAPEPGCLLNVELRLLDAGGATIDVQTSRPSTASLPGRVVELPSVSLSEVGTVSVAAVTSLRVQETRTLTATATSPSGQSLSGRLFDWSSSAPGVAAVNTAGVVTGVAPGSAVITASSGGKSGQTTVRVLARVAAVTVTPSPATVSVGGTRQLAVALRDAANNVLTDLAERTVTWTSDAPSVATVSNAGVVTGVRLGTANVTVSVDGVTRTVPVTVGADRVTVTPSPASVRVGGTAALTAQALDAAGAALSGVTFTWTSSDPAVATVDANGVVTGRAAGTATITATGAGASGTTTLTVTVLPLTISPSGGTLTVGSTLILTAQNAVGAVTWTSSDPSIVAVNSSGVVSAVFPGTATITASNAGQTASVTVNAVVSRVVYTSAAAENLSVGFTNFISNFQALDINGAVIAGVRPQWSVSPTGIVNIFADTSGLSLSMTGVAPGSVTLVARERRTGAALTSIPFTVYQPASLLSASPSTLFLSVGTSATVTVQVANANESPQVGRLVRATASSTSLTVTSSARTNASGIATFTVTATGTTGGQGSITFRPDGDNNATSIGVVWCVGPCLLLR